MANSIVEQHAPAASVDSQHPSDSHLPAHLARRALPLVTLAGILAGGAAWLGGQPTVAAIC